MALKQQELRGFERRRDKELDTLAAAFIERDEICKEHRKRRTLVERQLQAAMLRKGHQQYAFIDGEVVHVIKLADGVKTTYKSYRAPEAE